MHRKHNSRTFPHSHCNIMISLRKMVLLRYHTYSLMSYFNVKSISNFSFDTNIHCKWIRFKNFNICHENLQLIFFFFFFTFKYVPSICVNISSIIACLFSITPPQTSTQKLHLTDFCAFDS